MTKSKSTIALGCLFLAVFSLVACNSRILNSEPLDVNESPSFQMMNFNGPIIDNIPSPSGEGCIVTLVSANTVISKTAVKTEFTFPEPPLLDGYAFLGWQAQGKVYNIDEYIPVADDIICTAIWERVEVHVVCSTLAQYGERFTDDVFVLEGVEPTFTLPEPAATKEGYAFYWVDGENIYRPGEVVSLNSVVHSKTADGVKTIIYFEGKWMPYPFAPDPSLSVQ